MTRAERIEAALRRLKYRDEPGEPDRYCDHAAEPCPRCEEVRAALEPDPLSCPRCNHDPAVHKNGRCRYCEGPCAPPSPKEGT